MTIYDKMLERVQAMSDSGLKRVWDAACSPNAHQEDGWGTYVNGIWEVVEWDVWMDILYSEISARNIKVI